MVYLLQKCLEIAPRPRKQRKLTYQAIGGTKRRTEYDERDSSSRYVFIRTHQDCVTPVLGRRTHIFVINTYISPANRLFIRNDCYNELCESAVTPTPQCFLY
mmetsp:Transcript_34999/g.58572  ORF Transcript_34999/g.58572 Transcript_34999/m.58572 type:complete len:102 (-) Transcript_34999:580-885(-)